MDILGFFPYISPSFIFSYTIFLSIRMMCELCGKPVKEGFKVRLEGGVVTACRGCSRHGEVVKEMRHAGKPKPRKPKPQKEKDSGFSMEGEYELVDGYGPKVKSAREKRGWKQEDLGRAVNEPHSLIHRIELEKMEPSVGVARKLENKLGVRLLVRHMEDDEEVTGSEKKDLTLGDLVVVRRKEK
ncbi:MAG: TIGR00270 family protein [Candidatus Altiarchaeales archaeon]|nr:TIGR00270 family protein [Candidatus Altiarchaeales archaeon]MBD3416971.1 TIGR00270 family protein [Candidatus Altiarchaeales archaeon]